MRHKNCLVWYDIFHHYMYYRMLKSSKVKTRFAPSPTGFLHIGGARTALFNYLFAKHHGGEFYLRVEDTDRERSTQASIDAILNGMKWLDLDHDGEVVYQFANKERHIEVANQLLAEGKAYYCYASPEELETMRAMQKEKNLPLKYDGRWRDRDLADAPKDVKPVIRLKAPLEGQRTLTDLIQGEVTLQNEQLDDMVLLRADGTPTYMLSVVVDDHDMGITHVIRGDDHFMNMFRQVNLYDAMGWELPEFAHMPLIHGEDGAKLSKRHGALGVEAYEEMGYLPEAVCNYLLRLGWSHGDDEIISKADAIKWFDLDHVGKSPSRFDFKKLNHVNQHYMKEASVERLLKLLNLEGEVFESALPLFVGRSETLKDLKDQLKFLISPQVAVDEKASHVIANIEPEMKIHFNQLCEALDHLTIWTHEEIDPLIKAYIKENDLKFPKVGQPIRVALTGTTNAPSISDLIFLLGKAESIKRIKTMLGEL